MAVLGKVLRTGVCGIFKVHQGAPVGTKWGGRRPRRTQN